MPTLDEINAAAADTPVFILHLYDRTFLNGAALRAVGYTKSTPLPPGGEIQGRSSWQPNRAAHCKTKCQYPLLDARPQPELLGIVDRLQILDGDRGTVRPMVSAATPAPKDSRQLNRELANHRLCWPSFGLHP